MRRPNVLYICTDQQRFDALSCYGNDRLDTPNIDKLAAEGVLMRNAYCQSPVCAPSRASFLTGRYPRTCGVRQNGQRMPRQEKLVTKLFADAGYTVGLSGKLHIAPCHTSVCVSGEPRIDDGYSVFHWSHHPDFRGAKSNWATNEYNIWLAARGQEYNRVPYCGSPYVYIGPDTVNSHSHWCAEMAIEFIQSHSLYPENPWMFSLNFFDPHHDFDPPKALLEKYIARLTTEDLPNYQPGELDHKPTPQQVDHEGAYSTKGNFAYDAMCKEDHLLIKAAYYAMIEQLDKEVGRVVQTLKDTNQYEDTVIVFTSDHGEMLGDHGIYLKGGYFYDPMVKVPLIISWPGHFLKGVVREAMIELVDIAPTLLDIAQLPPYAAMQGKSFCKLLTEPDAEDSFRETVYCEYYNAMRHGDVKIFATMICDGRYKLNYYHSSNQGELYDLNLDPQERINLYNDASYVNIKITMLETMANRMAFTADPLPVREAAY